MLARAQVMRHRQIPVIQQAWPAPLDYVNRPSSCVRDLTSCPAAAPSFTWPADITGGERDSSRTRSGRAPRRDERLVNSRTGPSELPYGRACATEGLDRGDSMTSLTTTQDGEHLEQPISPEVSVARGLLDRADLLLLLDRAVTKRVTVISAPPGSGKTSLLRAWAERSTNLRRVAFVSVDRDQRNAQRFWSPVLDAMRSPGRSIDPETQSAAAAALDVLLAEVLNARNGCSAVGGGVRAPVVIEAQEG